MYTLETNKHHLGLNKLQGVPFGRLPAQLQLLYLFLSWVYAWCTLFWSENLDISMRFNIKNTRLLWVWMEELNTILYNSQINSHIHKWTGLCWCNGPTRREACGSMCKLLLMDMVKNTGRVEQMTNRYIEGKADEYSSKRAWSTIGEQYPEGLTREVIQVHKQWSRQGQTESTWKAKG